MTDPGLIVHGYHLFIGAISILGAIVGIIGGYHRIVVMPERERREQVAHRLAELEKETALQKQRLESGDRRFDDIMDTLEKLRNELRTDHSKLESKVDDIQRTLAASVWRGIGEER